jgi:hypothetical protein
VTLRGWLTKALAAQACLFSLATPVRAQEVNLATLNDAPKNRVYLRTGAEFGFVGAVGYARAVDVLDRRVLLLGEVTVPWAEFDTNDYQIRIGTLAPVLAWHGWNLAGSLAPTLRGTKNDLGTWSAFGFDAGVTGGYFSRHWFLAGEFGFDYTLTTHVTNSQTYRNIVYANARDGWYVNPGGNYRLGAQAGASFGHYDLVLRAGILRDMLGNPPLLPVYATLALVGSF